MSAPFPVRLRRWEKILGLGWLLFYIFLAGQISLLLLQTLGRAGDDLLLNEIYSLLSLAVTLALFWRFLRDSLTAVRPGRLLRGILFGFCLYELVQITLGLLYGSLLPELSTPNDENIQALAAERYWAMTAITVLLAPLIEEPLFRGLLFGWLRERSRLAAYLISSLLFAAMHLIDYLAAAPLSTLLWNLPLYALPAMVLCASYELGGTVWTPILLHALINALGMWAMHS